MNASKIPAALVSIYLSLSPISVIAASGDVLLEHLNAWETANDSMEKDQSAQETDIIFQERSDVFPDMSDTEEGNVLEESREDRIADFVSVEVDGKTVVFADVPRSAWFAPYVREIAERRIVSGYRDEAGNPTGRFGPQDNVTIEQMAKVMVYASGKLPEDCTTDPVINLTSSGTWSAPFIACAEKLQWAVYGDGSVDVHLNATRAQVIMTLMQAFDVPIAERTGDAFTDVTMSTQFGNAIEQAKRDGIVSGYTDSEGIPTGSFGPEDPVTRAEFAKIVTLGIQSYAD